MKLGRISFLLLLIGVTVLTGCASKKKVRSLEGQMNAVTDELVRLDEALQDTRAALQEEQNRYNELSSGAAASKSRVGALQEEAGVIEGIYRTPSGFQLPAIQIQQALKNAGYYTGALDGKIGPATRDAIRAFQKDQGLTADGVVGRQTWSKLKAYLDTIK